jgi:hypothetical protein
LLVRREGRKEERIQTIQHTFKVGKLFAGEKRKKRLLSRTFYYRPKIGQ